MDRLYKLENSVKKYDWGSPQWIPNLLNRENPSGEPWAELWMGVHPAGPSHTRRGSAAHSLDTLIRSDPAFFLGETAAQGYSTLPFLFKLLAAEHPLSMQAHPNREQALTGWERENAAGLALDDPVRNYRDRNHKPELLCALSPFQVICGFRELGLAKDMLKRLCSLPLPNALASALAPLQEAPDLKAFLESLLSIPAPVCLALGDWIMHTAQKFAPELPQPYAAEWEIVAHLARLFPGDPWLLAPVILNTLTLQPGESIFLPSAVLHSYLSGFGVELMANSDNVLRGGLSAKHRDIPELLKTLSYIPYKPEILLPTYAKGREFASYPVRCGEFSLSFRNSAENSNAPIVYTPNGPAIALNIQGELLISLEGELLSLEPGESAFIAPGRAPAQIRWSGAYTAFIAETGSLADNPGTFGDFWEPPLSGGTG